jgi:hypothetical protein
LGEWETTSKLTTISFPHFRRRYEISDVNDIPTASVRMKEISLTRSSLFGIAHQNFFLAKRNMGLLWIFGRLAVSLPKSFWEGQSLQEKQIWIS